MLVNFYYYICDRCYLTIKESDPHFEVRENHYCWDCSYILGKITETEYLGCCGIGLPNINATVRNNEIVIWIGKKPPWETNNKKRCHKHSQWRVQVFERDNFTCQKCGQRGGDLNAHHIKSWSKHPELRLDTSNGITLCVECHKEVHRQG